MTNLMPNIVSNHALASLMNFTKNFILILDSKCRILAISSTLRNFLNIETKLTHESSEELLNKLGISILRNGTNEIINQLPLIGLEHICKNKNNNDCYISWSFFPLLSDKQLPEGILLIGEDITQLKELSSQIERLDNIIKYSPGWIYWKDKNSIHLGCNERFAIAAGLRNRDEMIGKSDYELPWHRGAAKYNLDDKEVIESGKPKLNIEDTVPLRDHKQAVVISNKVPLRDSNGKVIGVLGIATDITERKNMEKELHQAKIAAETASQSKSEFIANMSHDIRTPLTGILGLIQEMINVADDTQTSLQKTSLAEDTTLKAKYLSLLHQLGDFTDKVQEDGQLLLGATDELLQLLNEILETMRLESGKTTENIESFDLRELIKHNIELMQPVARHKLLELSCEIEDSIPAYFKGLRNYLDRSLLNLMSNALKFTEQGFVKVKVELIDKNHSYHLGDEVKLTISVQDSGIGIPKDKFGAIFDHFSRLTPSYQGLYKGAGLGLYTVKRYVEAMRAKIKVESVVGKGTCFIITLPLTVSDHSDREKVFYYTPKTRKTILSTQSSMNAKEIVKTEDSVSILIVEDNSLAAKAVQFNLNRLSSNYASNVAATGTQAIKMAQERDYDLILMDIGLPDIDGIEVTRRIRALKDPKFGKIPILALTGHASNFNKKEEALAAGMQEIFTKPLPPSELESLLKRYVFKIWQESAIDTEPKIRVVEEASQVINWNKCLEQCGGDENCLRELLADLAVDLKISQERLSEAYATHDEDALRNELHRVHGGVVYLSLPQLDKALAEFHEAVKTKSQVPGQLEKTYVQLQQAMNAFWETLKKWRDRS